MQRVRRRQERLDPHAQCHQKLMIFAPKGAHHGMFLAADIHPHLGMHKKLYQALILSVLMPTLDCRVHKSQMYQLRRQPPWGIVLQVRLGRLQAAYQVNQPNFDRMKYQSLLLVGGNFKQGPTSILPDTVTKTASKSISSLMPLM